MDGIISKDHFIQWADAGIFRLASISPGSSAKTINNPVIILGCMRSGTSMLAQLVASHTEVATYRSKSRIAEANHLWHPKAHPWHKSNFSGPPHWFDPIEYTRTSVHAWTFDSERRIRTIFAFYQAFYKKLCFLNKSALIACMIPQIMQVFPHARLIHIYRDGRAVALSNAKKQHPTVERNADVFKRRGYYMSFEDILTKCAAGWCAQMLEIDRQVESEELKEKDVLLELSYEELCANAGEWLNRIATFLNLSPDGFTVKDLSHIKSMNYKYKETLDGPTVEKITHIMEPALRLKGYLV